MGKNYKSLFSVRLNAFMTENKITNHSVAVKMYLADNTISGYRTGRRVPSDPEKLRDLCIALNLSSDYLLGLSDVPSSL